MLANAMVQYDQREVVKKSHCARLEKRPFRVTNRGWEVFLLLTLELRPYRGNDACVEREIISGN